LGLKPHCVCVPHCYKPSSLRRTDNAAIDSEQASCMQMKAEGVSRRDLLGVAGAAVVAVPALANADTEYPNVPFLGGSDQVRAH
jgi:hypothetical protein